MMKKKMNPFGKGESKKMEAAEKKMAKSSKAYAAMEKKYEGKKSSSKMKKLAALTPVLRGLFYGYQGEKENGSMRDLCFHEAS